MKKTANFSRMKTNIMTCQNTKTVKHSDAATME